MNEQDALFTLVPGPPDWTIPWPALEASRLGACFPQMAATPQNPAYHGEGDVLAHTKLVCESLVGLDRFRSLEEGERRAVFFAALLHDVGKIRCTRLEDGRWTAPRHAAVGAAMVRETLWLDCGWCGRPDRQALRETVCALIRYHSLPAHAVYEADGTRRLLAAAANGALLPGFTVELLCLLAQADVLGRRCPDQAQLLESVELCGALAEENGCWRGPRAFFSPHAAFSYLSGRADGPDCRPYDDAWGEVILLSGLPGTGKDTWIGAHCAGLPVVSLDAIRAELGVPPSGPQGRVIETARARAKALLRERRPFVWNATNVTADLRRKQVELFASYRAATRIVYLETEWGEQRRRNGARAAVVPEAVILGMLAKLTPPEPREARRVEWRCI